MICQRIFLWYLGDISLICQGVFLWYLEDISILVNLKSVILLIPCHLPSHLGSEWTNCVGINFPDRIQLSSCPLRTRVSSREFPKVRWQKSGKVFWRRRRNKLPQKSPQMCDRKRCKVDAGETWDGPKIPFWCDRRRKCQLRHETALKSPLMLQKKVRNETWDGPKSLLCCNRRRKSDIRRP